MYLLLDGGQQDDPAVKVAYLRMVNKLIDGLQRDPEAFSRSVMGLRMLGVHLPTGMDDFPQLFAILHEEGHCGPDNTSLLQSLLQSLDRHDLLVYLERFQIQPDPPPSSSSMLTLATHHSKAVQSIALVCEGLSAVVGVPLEHSDSRDSGYSQQWVLKGRAPSPHTLQDMLSEKAEELGKLDIKRVFLDTSSERYKLFEHEDQSNEVTLWGVASFPGSHSNPSENESLGMRLWGVYICPIASFPGSSPVLSHTVQKAGEEEPGNEAMYVK